MRAVITLPLILLLALASPAAAIVKLGMDMPSMELPDIQGQKHNLQQMAKDKVALVVYWSVSCPVCRQEMPHLVALNKKLAGNPFVMIMVNGDGPAMVQAASGYAQQFRLPEPVLLDAGPDDAMPVADAFDLIATPSLLVFNPKGKLVHAQEVHADLKALEAAIAGAF